MQYVLNGKPIPLARPRIGKHGGYNPQADALCAAKWVLKSQCQVPFSDRHHVRILFEMPMPSSWTTRLRTDSVGKPHTGRPDIDNLIKFVLDAGNGVLWTDDAQIAVLQASKVWAEVGRTTISFDP